MLIRMDRSSPTGSILTIVNGQNKKTNVQLKILFCTAFMALYVLSMAYKGNLLAQLVRVEYEAPVETFQVGLAQPTFK